MIKQQEINSIYNFVKWVKENTIVVNSKTYMSDYLYYDSSYYLTPLTCIDLLDIYSKQFSFNQN